MSQACSRAMRLPEIVSIGLEGFQCTNALFAALQVPRPWADEATMVLWREGYPNQALIHGRHAERVQYYASKIPSLDPAYSGEMWSGSCSAQPPPGALFGSWVVDFL